jgi:multidrug resistance efflux pump
VVVKRYRHLGDYAPAGSPLLSMYNPDLLYVEADLEEDRLPGVEPGHPIRIELYAFAEPFRGLVVRRLRGDGRPLHRHAGGAGRLAGLGLQPRRPTISASGG